MRTAPEIDHHIEISPIGGVQLTTETRNDDDEYDVTMWEGIIHHDSKLQKLLNRNIYKICIQFTGFLFVHLLTLQLKTTESQRNYVYNSCEGIHHKGILEGGKS